MEFRKLKANEIDCRIGKVSKDEKGFSLLLYKDARVDMKLLDETVGAMNWQKHYSRDNANCVVSIWDAEKKTWIEKEDTGTESYTEAEKGLASDSFKRACFNWGIGRELYTAPFIWITGYEKTDHFTVTDIAYDEEGNISLLQIIENKSKAVVFSLNSKVEKTEKKAEKKAEQPKVEQPTADPTIQNITPYQKADLLKELNRTKVKLSDVLTRYSVKALDDMPQYIFDKAMKILLAMPTV